MGFIKTKFEALIKKHGHKVLVKHTDKKRSCPNQFDVDHDTNCPQCYGLNYRYDYYIAKTRKIDKGIITNQKDEKNPINFSGEMRKYYFMTGYSIDEDDFIIEYKRNKLELYLVTNIEPQYGDQGDLAYFIIVARKVSINNDIIQQDLLRFKNE